MADIAVLDIKVANLEEKCEETVDRVGAIEEIVDKRGDRIHSLEIWRNGNGARGAEARLQIMESDMVHLKACIENVASDESIAKIAQVAVKGIIENARNKDRTLVNKAKAFAPYFAAGCALVAGLVAALVK